MELLIKNAECWKCKGVMKIALVFTGGGFSDPSEFDEKELALARANGVIIESRYSKMLEEEYNANVCPNCRSIFGKMFLTQYWYEEDSLIIPLP